MEYMTLAEIRSTAADIRAAFDDLIEKRRLANRKGAAQWSFFRLCLERTLGQSSEECGLTSVQSAQYKFEVEAKLRHFYLGGGRAVDFVFTLHHKRDCRHLAIGPGYPETSGYLLLVRDRRGAADKGLASPVEEKDYIEKVVAACIDAEFEAYQALPAIDEARLEKWFMRGGAAYNDLVHTLTRMAQRGWILTNPFNPSTKRLLAVTVSKIEGGRAYVRTTEYWYLRWWSTVEGKYRYPYRETNRQAYILVATAEGWRVENNIRPSPRSSTPHRRR